MVSVSRIRHSLGFLHLTLAYLGERCGNGDSDRRRRRPFSAAKSVDLQNLQDTGPGAG